MGPTSTVASTAAQERGVHSVMSGDADSASPWSKVAQAIAAAASPHPVDSNVSTTMLQLPTGGMWHASGPSRTAGLAGPPSRKCTAVPLARASASTRTIAVAVRQVDEVSRAAAITAAGFIRRPVTRTASERSAPGRGKVALAVSAVVAQVNHEPARRDGTQQEDAAHIAATATAARGREEARVLKEVPAALASG